MAAAKAAPSSCSKVGCVLGFLFQATVVVVMVGAIVTVYNMRQEQQYNEVEHTLMLKKVAAAQELAEEFKVKENQWKSAADRNEASLYTKTEELNAVLQERNELLKQEVSLRTAAKSTLETLEAKKEELQKVIDDNETLLGQKEQAHQEELGSTKAHLTLLEKNLAESNQEKEALKLEHAASIEALESSLTQQCNSKLQDDQKLLEAGQQQVADIQQRQQQAEQQVADTIAQLQQSAQQLQDTQQQLKDSEAAVVAAVRQTEAVRAEGELAAERFQVAEADRSAAQQQLSDERKEHQITKETLQSVKNKMKVMMEAMMNPDAAAPAAAPAA